LTEQETCQATKKDGTRCTCAPISGTRFCYWHSPRTKRKKETEEFLSKAREGIDLSTIAGVNRLLEIVVKGLLTRKIDQKTAQVIGYNLNILSRNITNIELEKRVERLEKQFEEVKNLS
jgi:hypothetical protein